MVYIKIPENAKPGETIELNKKICIRGVHDAERRFPLLDLTTALKTQKTCSRRGSIVNGAVFSCFGKSNWKKLTNSLVQRCFP